MREKSCSHWWVRNLRDELRNRWSSGKHVRRQKPNGHGGWKIQSVKMTISSIMQSAGGWQIYIQKENGTWFPLPGTPGEGHLCHTSKPCQLPQLGKGGGKERGTTWPPLPVPFHYQEGLSWAPALGFGWPSQQLLGTKADPSGMCSHGSPGSWWLDPPVCLEGLWMGGKTMHGPTT